MRTQATLVGRERELAELVAAAHAAHAGHGRLMLVAGEAGVGKTRLIEEAIAASGLVPLAGAAWAERSTPYAPVAAVLRAYRRRRPGGVPGELAAMLPELPAGSAAGSREALAVAFHTAFEDIGRTAPTAVVLDDLHWADAATLELLGTLAEAASDWRLLLVGAYRNDEVPRGHALRTLRNQLRRGRRLQELVIEPLDAAATTALAAEALGGEPGASLTAALRDRTQGVPFFIEELAAALREGGYTVAGRRGLELAPGVHLPLPDTIRDALRLRTAGLSREGRAALEAAAAIGRRVELGLLSELAPEAGIDELLGRQLLVELAPGRAAFAHDLAREAVYADTSWTRRRFVHRSLATLLETRGADPGVVAEHWLACGEFMHARPRLLEAARRSCRLYAYRDAARDLNRALEVWPPDEDGPGRLGVLEELARCAELCGELTDAQRALEEVAAGLAGTRELRRRAAILQRLATVHELQDAWPRAAEVHAEAGEFFAAVGLHADAATAWLRAADAQADTERSLELLALAEQGATLAGRLDLELRCHSLRGLCLAASGERDTGLELLRTTARRAVAEHETDAALDAYWALGAMADAWFDLEGAQAALEQGVELCRTTGRHEDEAFCLSCLSVVLRHRGEWSRAETIARDVLRGRHATGPGRAHALLTRGRIAAARGQTRRARPLLAQGLALARRIGLPGSTVDGQVGMAVVDEVEGAVACWSELLAAPPDSVVAAYAPGLATATSFGAKRGDVELLRACADALASWVPRFANPGTLAALAHVLGELALVEGSRERAIEHFSTALRHHGDADTPFERALSQQRAGAALVASGERELGAELALTAYRTFNKLGARPFADRAAAELAALGQHVDERQGRRASDARDPTELSRRELEILRLVAVGRTNREIAQQLFLSPRTVDMHVRNVLAKLRCRSRTEATARAHELSLITVQPARGR